MTPPLDPPLLSYRYISYIRHIYHIDIYTYRSDSLRDPQVGHGTPHGAASLQRRQAEARGLYALTFGRRWRSDAPPPLYLPVTRHVREGRGERDRDRPSLPDGAPRAVAQSPRQPTGLASHPQPCGTGVMPSIIYCNPKPPAESSRTPHNKHFPLLLS